MFGTWAMRGLGGLLILAAALKIYGFGVEPIGLVGLLVAPEFQIALIQGEIALGIWFLFGKARIAAWFTALFLFTVFAGVSFYQGWIGQSSCGCFGRLSVSPWYAFALDVALLTALLLGRPDLQPLRDNPRRSLRA